MNKTNILITAVIALILLNISLLVFGGLKQPEQHMPPPGQHMQIQQVISEKLNFDEAQRAAYEQIIKKHIQSIRVQEDQIRAAKDKLYGNLFVDDQAVKDEMLQQISSVQMKIEQIHYDHFIDIKKMCNNDQLLKFNELQAELGRLLKKRPPRKR